MGKLLYYVEVSSWMCMPANDFPHANAEASTRPVVITVQARGLTALAKLATVTVATVAYMYTLIR